MFKRLATFSFKSTPSRPHPLRKLIQATALGAILVLLAAAPIEAGPITCGFGDFGSEDEGCETVEADTSIFNWGNYAIKLEFGDLNGSFNVTIDDVLMNPSGESEEFENNFDDRKGEFQAYQCIPIAGGESCVDFVVTGTPSPIAWEFYNITFFWTLNTNADFPNGDGPIGQVRVLHNQSFDFPVNTYTRDMCLLMGNDLEGCTYFAEIEGIPDDPAIRTRDTDFSSFTVAWVATIPEPSSLLLLGVGVAGVLARRRRRSTRPEAELPV